jgi:DNA-binding transcriptional LysR family regulator
VLPPALAKFRHAHPDARVLIRTAANLPLLEMPQVGEVDFVLGSMTDPQAMQGLSFELLYAEPPALAVRAGHPLCAMAEGSLGRMLVAPSDSVWLCPPVRSGTTSAAKAWSRSHPGQGRRGGDGPAASQRRRASRHRDGGCHPQACPHRPSNPFSQTRTFSFVVTVNSQS